MTVLILKWMCLIISEAFRFLSYELDDLANSRKNDHLANSICFPIFCKTCRNILRSQCSVSALRIPFLNMLERAFRLIFLTKFSKKRISLLHGQSVLSKNILSIVYVLCFNGKTYSHIINIGS